jgi:hypothetical protein
MGFKAAFAPVSSYAAKKTDLWPDLLDRIDGALLMIDLTEIEVWLELHALEVPGAWREPLADRIAMRRDELAAEDIGGIIRDRFDFS